MNCKRFRDLIALHVGGDLPSGSAGELNQHLARCEACAGLYRSLEGDRSRLRSLRQDTVTTGALAEMRQGVLARIHSGQERPGLLIRIERALLAGFRKPRFALASIGIVTILSVITIGQMFQTGLEASETAAVFEGDDLLLRPEGYREWIFVGIAGGGGYGGEIPAPQAASPGLVRSVYINPAAYRRYISTGEFPEGTVLILESAKAETKSGMGLEGWYEKEFVALQASVKDSRFEGGWGYFDFTGQQGGILAKARPDSAACLSCHRDRAETDHVFTQFYPKLRAAAGVL